VCVCMGVGEGFVHRIHASETQKGGVLTLYMKALGHMCVHRYTVGERVAAAPSGLLTPLPLPRAAV